MSEKRPTPDTPIGNLANNSAHPARRKRDRLAVSSEVVLRRSGKTSYRVKLHDFSPSGCKLDFVERPVLAEVVWVKFDQLESIEASVCWIEGFVVGLQFRTEIHPAVFENLARKIGSSQGT